MDVTVDDIFRVPSYAFAPSFSIFCCRLLTSIGSVDDGASAFVVFAVHGDATILSDAAAVNCDSSFSHRCMFVLCVKSGLFRDRVFFFTATVWFGQTFLLNFYTIIHQNPPSNNNEW
jgi:hypothetical protein